MPIDPPPRLHPFLEWAWAGQIEDIRALLDDTDLNAGFDGKLMIPTPDNDSLNMKDPVTGMNALHIAVGRNNLELAKLLIDAGIDIIPDGEGRMPSLIAALCETSEEMQDYIAAEEEKLTEEKVEADQ